MAILVETNFNLPAVDQKNAPETLRTVGNIPNSRGGGSAFAHTLFNHVMHRWVLDCCGKKFAFSCVSSLVL